MSVRKLCAALGTTAVVAAGLASATLAPANADPSSTPSATDYVGVGSDTTQFVVSDLINGKDVNGTHVSGYNEGVAAGSPKVASWDACTVPAGKLYPCTPGSATDASQYITLRAGAAPIPRPNGSGAGKKLLYGTTDNPAVTFARSSGGLSTDEVNAGLVAYPFAVDTLVTVTAPVTNAPATLTPQQILGIYNGSITNWSQVGGKDGVINPLQPQSGSGTLSFFKTQLQTINGGTAPTDIAHDHELFDSSTGKPCSTAGGTCVDTLVQEHDPTVITNDPNAIAPFSLGRANLAGPSAVSVIKGYSARRALYNVLRSHSASGVTDNPAWFSGTDAMNALFGKAGFMCSAAARPIIEADGFKQLLNFNDGGSCGLPVAGTSAPDLSVYDADGVAPTVTAAAVGNKAYGQAHAIAVSVAGAGATPTGDVKVNVGSFVGTGTLANGVATVAVPAGLGAGSYDAAVTYLGDSNFSSASTDAPFAISKAKTAASETFASKTKKGAKKLAGVVKIVTSPSSLKAPGSVSVLKGHTKVGGATLHSGQAKVNLNLKKLKKGSNKLTIVYSGASNFAGVKKTFTVVRK